MKVQALQSLLFPFNLFFILCTTFNINKMICNALSSKRNSQNFTLIQLLIHQIACLPITEQWTLGWREAIILLPETHIHLFSHLSLQINSLEVNLVKDYPLHKGQWWCEIPEEREKKKKKGWKVQKKWLWINSWRSFDLQKENNFESWISIIS